MVAVDFGHAVINGAVHQAVGLPVSPIRSRMT